MSYVVPPPAPVSLPVVGIADRFPVHRIYCVGRNYVEHAQEMGHSGREAPFFFMKPADAVLLAEPGQTVDMPYPTLTSNLHHGLTWSWPLAWAAPTSGRRTLPSTFMATPWVWT